MPESLTTVEESPSLIAYRDFCYVVSTSNNLDRLKEADAVDDFLNFNTPESRSGGCATMELRVALLDANIRPEVKQRQHEVANQRQYAIVQALRSAIQGKRMPVEELEPAIGITHDGLVTVGLKSPVAIRAIRRESLRVWRDSQDPLVLRRTAEVYKHYGRPERYGYMMARIAMKES